MVKRKCSVTQAIVRKIHILLSDSETGEEVINFLRSTESVFMKEVSQFVQIELDKMKDEFDEEFLMYLGSIMGAAYIMGFLIAREADHEIYDGLVNFDSIIGNVVGSKEVDRLIDKNLEKGKTPKEIGKIVTSFFDKKSNASKKKNIIYKRKTPKKKKLKLDIDFDEGEL